MSDHVLGVDLGGSNVRLALTDLSGTEVATSSAATTQGDARSLIGQLDGLARELAQSADIDWSRIAGMAVGVPGAVHADGHELRLAPNLPPMADIDVAARLGERLGVPVALDNDVNMATLAEQRHGRGVGVPDFVFMAVGTGIGMGIVATGRLQRGATGAAGEIGFLPLGADPFDRANHVRGPLEEVAGGAGVVRRYVASGGAPKPGLSALDVYGLRDTGDPRAAAVLDDQARATALAVVSAISMLDPALVVFGGGIGNRDDFVARVRTQVARLTSRLTVIETSELGERGGLVGASELARERARDRANGTGTSPRPWTTNQENRGPARIRGGGQP